MFPQNMEERIRVIDCNISIYRISIHSKLLHLEVFFFYRYLGEMVLNMPNTFLETQPGSGFT